MLPSSCHEIGPTAPALPDDHDPHIYLLTVTTSESLRTWWSNPRSRQLVSWTAVAVWAALIFSLSSVSDFPIKPKARAFSDAVHLGEYAILTVLLITALRTHALSVQRAVRLAAFLALLYGASDEFHQSFVRNRTASILDLLVDATAIGAVAFGVSRWGWPPVIRQAAARQRE
jgi:VanZ family protein